MSKRLRLAELARARRRDELPPHLGLQTFHNGQYDKGEFVVPWTRSACNVDSDVLVMGQDWNSVDNLEGPFNKQQALLGQQPQLVSNVRLQELLRRHLGMTFADTYATDLFVFAKPGGMTARIPRRHLDYCARKYAVPQIEIVSPLVVICLGGTTFNSLRRVLAPTERGYLSLAAASQRQPLYAGRSEIFIVPHTGSRPFHFAGGHDGCAPFWKRVAARLDELRIHRAGRKPL